MLGRTLRLAVAVIDGPGGRRIADAVSLRRGNIHRGVYTRTVNLADDNLLSLKLRVVPPWLGSAGSVRLLVLLATVGAAVLIRASRKGGSALSVAVGVTLLAAGIAQVALARSVLAALLCLVLLFWGVLRGGLRVVRRLIRLIGRSLRRLFRRRVAEDIY